MIYQYFAQKGIWERPLTGGETMFLFILGFIIVAFIATGSSKLKFGESSRDMINAEWLDCSDKFDLITRWGVKG